MQTSLTPVTGASLFISNTTSSAPRRRGRPRVHANDSAKKAAYRSRLREKRIRNKKRTLRRDISRLTKATEGTSRVHVYPCGFRSVFTAPNAEGRKLSNAILASLGAGLKQGQFMTDAPAGCGELVSGGYDSDRSAFINGVRRQANEEVVVLADGRRAPLKNGRRVAPQGWSSHKAEETGSIRSRFEKQKISAGETDRTFIDKFEDRSKLTCYKEGCRRKVWGIRTVKDREKFHCDEHAPVSEAA